MAWIRLSFCAIVFLGCNKQTEPEVKANPEKPSVVSATSPNTIGITGSASVPASHSVLGTASIASAPTGGSDEAVFGLGLSGPGGHAAGGVPIIVHMLPKGVTVGAGLPPEVVKRIARANFPRFRYCYELFLKVHPKTLAEVNLSFEVDSKGGVVKLVSTPGTDKDLDVCVGKAFAAFSFPQPDGVTSTKVTYGLDFKWELPPAAIPSTAKP